MSIASQNRLLRITFQHLFWRYNRKTSNNIAGSTIPRNCTFITSHPHAVDIINGLLTSQMVCWRHQWFADVINGQLTSSTDSGRQKRTADVKHGLLTSSMDWWRHRRFADFGLLMFLTASGRHRRSADVSNGLLAPSCAFWRPQKSADVIDDLLTSSMVCWCRRVLDVGAGAHTPWLRLGHCDLQAVDPLFSVLAILRLENVFLVVREDLESFGDLPSAFSHGLHALNLRHRQRRFALRGRTQVSNQSVQQW